MYRYIRSVRNFSATIWHAYPVCRNASIIREFRANHDFRALRSLLRKCTLQTWGQRYEKNRLRRNNAFSILFFSPPFTQVSPLPRQYKPRGIRIFSREVSLTRYFSSKSEACTLSSNFVHWYTSRSLPAKKYHRWMIREKMMAPSGDVALRRGSACTQYFIGRSTPPTMPTVHCARCGGLLDGWFTARLICRRPPLNNP